MKKPLVHMIKLKMARVKWFFSICDIVLRDRESIKNVRFLFNMRKELHDELLSLERYDNVETPQKDTLRSQVELLDMIISSFKKNGSNR